MRWRTILLVEASPIRTESPRAAHVIRAPGSKNAEWCPAKGRECPAIMSRRDPQAAPTTGFRPRQRTGVAGMSDGISGDRWEHLAIGPVKAPNASVVVRRA